MKTHSHSPSTQTKERTGIAGFDEITQGGLPRGRTTLLEAGPGAGKTIMALQMLVNGASRENQPGIFVAFEESAGRIVANAASFGWNLHELQKKKLFFLEAQPTLDLLQSGSFDLGGMLAALGAKVREMKAKRIVFDALDIVLALLRDPLDQRREVYRLHEWLLEQGLTAIITAKAGEPEAQTADQPQLGFMQFMVDCAVLLKHEVVDGVSQRNLRVAKYRGSVFSENEAPFLIGSGGLEVAAPREMGRAEAPAATERVSCGVARLDTMLGGGYYRNAIVLVTGLPGTAKTTLAGAFAAAACQRGERTLFISFDSDANEVVRNLDSVRIRLARHVRNGMLHLVSARTISGSAEIHLMQIKSLAQAQRARCVVIDPVSALVKATGEETARGVTERLLDWAKAAGITLLCTSLLERARPEVEGTDVQISTLSDTWIHLNYQIHAGERNRALSIIKSRGTAHSNQVRELLLSSRGVTLADAYTAGGEVLMGTLRWERERNARAEREESAAAVKQKQAGIEAEEEALEARFEAVARELKAKRAEKHELARVARERTLQVAEERNRMNQLRGKDAA